MKIVDILSEDLIVPDLRADSSEGVLQELVACMCHVRPDIDGEFAVRVLLERERVGSTGVAHGLAFPHARVPNIQRVIGCFGRSSHGIGFRALDAQPTHLFVGILAPETGGLHLKALARVSRLFKDSEFRNKLMTVPDRHGMWTLILEEDRRVCET